MTIHRGTSAFVGVAFVGILALLAALATPATAQLRAGLVDPNKVAENELAQLPNMTPAIVKSMLERRPFKSAIELNKFLLDQKLTPEQVKAFYGKAFVSINLNTGTKDEFMLIPGVGARMSAEFAEYRPWKTSVQFDKEIGKYVGQQETDRLKQYVFIPTN
jgi:DNA uptake protein ComE-like DNA-binding protein